MLAPTRWFGVTTSDAERDLASEPALIAEITKVILALQADDARKQGRPLRRGTHAKGICARAQFEVLDVSAGRDPALATRLAQGIFAKPGLYPAVVRFANSDPNVNSDFKADVRAMSFFIEAPSGRLDYTLQNAPTLPLNDARVFLATIKVVAAASPPRALWALPFNDKLRVLRALALAGRQSRGPVRPYQQLRYWSTVPFRHGASEVIKYSATPGPGNRALALQRNNPNALQDELARHLEGDGERSAFEFALQFLDAGRMTYWGERGDGAFWTENASVKWDETQAPFHTVARLTLLPRSRLPPDASEAISFDVNGNSSTESAPLGSINRARWPAEVASRKARTSRADAGGP